jgi:hypothetical protein
MRVKKYLLLPSWFQETKNKYPNNCNTANKTQEKPSAEEISTFILFWRKKSTKKFNLRIDLLLFATYFHDQSLLIHMKHKITSKDQAL